VRIDGRVVSQATVVIIGVTLDGERRVLGVDVGASEDRGFWTAFLRSLVERGLVGVRLVISDGHEGLKHAMGTVLSGAVWPRGRVHFMRNLLATVPQAMRQPIARDRADDLRAARRRERPDAAAQGGRRPARPAPPSRGIARGRRGGHPRA
jgi:transposase-like protein